MKTEKMKTKDYFKLSWSAYFADYNWDFIIVRDQDPWKEYYRQYRGPFPFAGMPGLEINKTYGWFRVEMDTSKLKKYMLSRAKPESWKNISQKFYATHDVAMICDGPTLSIEFTKPNG